MLFLVLFPGFDLFLVVVLQTENNYVSFDFEHPSSFLAERCLVHAVNGVVSVYIVAATGLPHSQNILLKYYFNFLKFVIVSV